MTPSRIAFLAALAPLAGCVAVHEVPPEPYPFRVDYGRVETVEVVARPSNAPAGAMVGGILGLILSGPSAAEKVVGMAAGATAGGVLTAAAEQSSPARAYGVRFPDGRLQRIYAEPLDLREGDCVAVESGRFVNVRRVSSAHCEPGPTPPPYPAKGERDAQACAAAKEELLRAQGREAVDVAVRKVRVLCGD
jgi:hypothetical protein